MYGCDRWVWQLSQYDGRIHAFERAADPVGYLEAACSHSVPCARVVRSHAGPRCLACLLIVGDHLAEYHVGC